MNCINRMTDASNSNLYEIEQERESVTLDLSRARFERNETRFREHNRGGDSATGRVIENRLCGPFATAIQEFLDPADKPRGWNAGNKAAVRGMIRDLGLTPLELSYGTLKAILNELFRSNSGSLLSNYCSLVVDTLLRCAEYKELVQLNRSEAKIITKRVQIKKGGSINNIFGINTIQAARRLAGLSAQMRVADRLQLGAKLIELLIESTGAFHLRKEYRGKHDTPVLLEAADELLALVQKSADVFSVLSPQYQMMVIPPRNWTHLYNGGYILPLTSLHPPLVKQRRAELKQIQQYDLSAVYQSVNTIQRTRWRINTRILEVAQALWDMGGGIAGIPEADDRTPPKPPVDSDEFPQWKQNHPVEYRRWADAAQAVYKHNRTVGAARIRVSYQLRIARENMGFSRLYFPHTCDFRGRVYPLPSYVNPQSDDLGKSLLQFADCKKLGSQGGYWLSVHVANCAGVDKVAFEDRVRWVREHEDEIRQYAADPLGHLGWADMDSPFQFLAACFEYAGFLKQGEEFCSRLPIAMDGTCNGLQHLSAMLRDEVGGEAVNLVPSAAPHDIYTAVLEKLREILTDMSQTAENDSDRVKAAGWLPYLTRTIVKRPVMTTPYGVSAFGIRDQVLEQVLASGLFTGSVFPYVDWARFLVTPLQRAIAEVIVAAPLAMGWLQTSARIICDADKNQQGISWEVPGSGFPVIQRYRAPRGSLVNVFIGKQRIRVCDGELDEQRLDVRRQLNGISPNVIHSLDASMMMLTVNKLRAQGLRHFALIHDSYGAHACDIPILNQVLREQFAAIYCSHDVLKELKDRWEQKFGITLPELPEHGSLDPGMVNYSRYFFA